MAWCIHGQSGAQVCVCLVQSNVRIFSLICLHWSMTRIHWTHAANQLWLPVTSWHALGITLEVSVTVFLNRRGMWGGGGLGGVRGCASARTHARTYGIKTYSQLKRTEEANIFGKIDEACLHSVILPQKRTLKVKKKSKIHTQYFLPLFISVLF